MPRLFEPRLVALSTNVIRFIGFERADDAWVMQEWVLLCQVSEHPEHAGSRA